MRRQSSLPVRAGSESAKRSCIRPSQWNDILNSLSQLAPQLTVTEALLASPTTDFIVSVWTAVLEAMNVATGYVSQPAVFLPNCQPELYEGIYQYALLFRTMSTVMKDFNIALQWQDLMEPKSKRTCSLLRRFIHILDAVYSRGEFVEELLKARRYKQSKIIEALEMEQNLQVECERLTSLIIRNEDDMKLVNASIDECNMKLAANNVEKENLAKEIEQVKDRLDKKKANWETIKEEITSGEESLQKIKAAFVTSPQRFQREVDEKSIEFENVSAELAAEELHEDVITGSIDVTCKWEEFLSDILAIFSTISNVQKEMKEKINEIHEMEKRHSSLDSEYNDVQKTKNFFQKARMTNQERMQALKIQKEAKVESLKNDMKVMKSALEKYRQQLQEKEVVAAGLEKEKQFLGAKCLEWDKSLQEMRENAFSEYSEMMKKLDIYKAGVAEAIAHVHKTMMERRR